MPVLAGAVQNFIRTCWFLLSGSTRSAWSLLLNVGEAPSLGTIEHSKGE